MKKIAPIIIENSDIYEVSLTIREDWELKDLESRKRTFRDSKKITRKNSDISFYTIDVTLNDLSLFWFNKELQTLAKETYKKDIFPKLKVLSLELRTLSNIAYWIITLENKTFESNSLKLKEEYKKLEDEITQNITYLLKNMKASSNILWELRKDDLEGTFKEIQNYIKYHQKEIEKYKNDFFTKGAKSENIGLSFYNF